MTDNIRLLIVDDSRFMRQALKTLLAYSPHIQVVGEAKEGAEALRLTMLLRPDVITMDLEMHGIDGQTAIIDIMARAPTPIVVFSAHSRNGAQATIRALKAGAVDFLEKPELASQEKFAAACQQLNEKLNHWGRQSLPDLGSLQASRMGSAPPAGAMPGPPVPSMTEPVGAAIDLVAITVSTGGPKLLVKLFSMTGALTCPIVIAQHMPPMLTNSLAYTLAHETGLNVFEADDGAEIKGSQIAVLAGGVDATLQRTPTGGFRVRQVANQGFVQPSGDVLLDGALQAARNPLGIILSGLGTDGVQAARRMKAAGRRVLVQDPRTALASGMPQAAVDAGAASDVLSLADIAQRLRQWAGRPLS